LQLYQQLYKDGATYQSFFKSKNLSVDTITQQLSEVKANLNPIDSKGRKQITQAKISLTQINATGSKQISSTQPKPH
jgi:HlyD family secretion protein